MTRVFSRSSAGILVASLGTLACGVWFLGSDLGELTHPLTILLAAFALVSNLTAARWDSSLELSGSLMAALVAAAFVGPAAGFAVVLFAETLAWAIERLRPVALPQNVLSIGAPVIGTGVLLAELFPRGAGEGAIFYLGFGGAAAIASGLNLALVAAIHFLHDRVPPLAHLRALRELLLVWALNIAMTVAIASMYGTAGFGAAALVMIALIAFTYQASLVARADHRARQYASLSWGVLSGTIRNLDMRDGRTARHCAAVARFARDIAAEAGLSERDQELAHTAGLLHDVGKFALSDRVMERGVNLNENDWKGIRRHPELGAAMLKDVGGYGPVAEIIRAHHERLDGRGFPRGLASDEIPELAKVVAVAEVYDTLTSEDTYRTPMSSFEALNELRRVAGKQLDGRYVEALGRVLSGTGTDYRHAGAADFDRELDIERRIGEAAVGAEGSAG